MLKWTEGAQSGEGFLGSSEAAMAMNFTNKVTWSNQQLIEWHKMFSMLRFVHAWKDVYQHFEE